MENRWLRPAGIARKIGSGDVCTWTWPYAGPRGCSRRRRAAGRGQHTEQMAKTARLLAIVSNSLPRSECVAKQQLRLGRLWFEEESPPKRQPCQKNRRWGTRCSPPRRPLRACSSPTHDAVGLRIDGRGRHRQIAAQWVRHAMPGKNGAEVARQVHGKRTALPIILLTDMSMLRRSGGTLVKTRRQPYRTRRQCRRFSGPSTKHW